MMDERAPGTFSPGVIVNGVRDAGVPALDRGLAYGDGVFRTLAISDGEPTQWRRHYSKLASDCERLGLTPPAERVLRAEVREVSRARVRAAAKVIVTRGVGGRGYRHGAALQPTRIVMSAAFPDYPLEYRRSGVHARMCDLKLACQPALAGIKHLNRLENVLARAEWDDADVAEGLLCDCDGNVVCGTMSNVFMNADGCLVTPDLTRCGVAGVTRERIIEAAAREGVACEIRTIDRDELASATEIFFVNSLIGVWPVKSLGERRYAIGDAARRARQWLEQDHDA
jgi:4-amino-4-deoxychorismate lyase